MSNHVPGPWTYAHPSQHVWKIRTENGSLIAEYYSANSDENPQNEATARLIAAAPELLAALDQAVQLLDNIDGRALANGCLLSYAQDLPTFRAALAKARGEATPAPEPDRYEPARHEYQADRRIDEWAAYQRENEE